MGTIVTEMIQILTSGISTYASGFGAGVKSLITEIFLTGSGTTQDPYALGTVGMVVCGFAAISLAVGLSRFVLNWVTSLGAKN